MMTNPRRELCSREEDKEIVAAFSEINDCRLVVLYYELKNGVIIGCLYRVYLPINLDGQASVIDYAYLVCSSSTSRCLTTIDASDVLYVVKDGNKLLLVVDDYDKFSKIIKCLKLDIYGEEGKLLCLNNLFELKEYIECITEPK